MYRPICILLVWAALVALAITPDESLSPGTYALLLFGSKGIAALAFYTTYLILRKYEPKTDRHH